MSDCALNRFGREYEQTYGINNSNQCELSYCLSSPYECMQDFKRSAGLIMVTYKIQCQKCMINEMYSISAEPHNQFLNNQISL